MKSLFVYLLLNSSPFGEIFKLPPCNCTIDDYAMAKVPEFNPIPTRLCHMTYCCSDKSYPCLVGIGLSKVVKKCFMARVRYINRLFIC